MPKLNIGLRELRRKKREEKPEEMFMAHSPCKWSKTDNCKGNPGRMTQSKDCCVCNGHNHGNPGCARRTAARWGGQEPDVPHLRSAGTEKSCFPEPVHVEWQQCEDCLTNGRKDLKLHEKMFINEFRWSKYNWPWVQTTFSLAPQFQSKGPNTKPWEDFQY